LPKDEEKESVKGRRHWPGELGGDIVKIRHLVSWSLHKVTQRKRKSDAKGAIEMGGGPESGIGES